MHLQPYRQTFVSLRKHIKHCSKYYRSFTGTEKVGPVAYCLTLPATASIRSIFHAPILKRRPKIDAVVNPTSLLVGNDVIMMFAFSHFLLPHTFHMHCFTHTTNTNILYTWTLDPSLTETDSYDLLILQFCVEVGLLTNKETKSEQFVLRLGLVIPAWFTFQQLWPEFLKS